MKNKKIKLIIIFILALSFCLLIPQNKAIAQSDIESFENGWNGWEPGNDGLAPSFETVLSTEQAFDGIQSVKMTLQGTWDDGTMWIVKKYKVSPGETLKVKVNFQLWSKVFSAVNNWYVVGFIGQKSPTQELDFTRVGQTDLTAGWRNYYFEQTITANQLGEFYVAVGISCVWETTRFYYLDYILVNYGSPGIGISKTVDETVAKSGDVLTYNLNYSNEGNIFINNVILEDPIPPGSQYLLGSASGTARYDGSKLTWDLGSLSPGQTGFVTFKVIVN